MKNKFKELLKRKSIRISLLILIAVVVGISAYLYNMYTNIANAVDTMNKPLNRKVSDKREDEIMFNRKDPISILLVGVDERSGDAGRTDSILVMTLNPTLKTSKLISIPRDTLADLMDEEGKFHSQDKMNHAYAIGGIEMTIHSIENFLNIPIDYYINVNMEGFRDIVDAVGGIDVTNKFEFELEGVRLAKGDLHLNGSEALIYARMRKDDPRGDFGRQERQREVISKVIEKGTSLKALTNYSDLLKALEVNVKTNLTLDDMLGIQKIYKPAVDTIEKIEIEGNGGLIFNGKQNIWYYIVSDESRQALSDQLREHLGLPKTKIKPTKAKTKIEYQKSAQPEIESNPVENEITNVTPVPKIQQAPQSTPSTNEGTNNPTTENGTNPQPSDHNNQSSTGGDTQTGGNTNNPTGGDPTSGEGNGQNPTPNPETNGQNNNSTNR